MSDWKTHPLARIAFGGLSAVAVVAALASLTGGQRAQSLGLTRHGELAVAVDAGAADVVGVTGITPGTPTQVLTVSDSGVPVWRGLPGSVTLAGTGVVEVQAGDAGTVDAAGASDASVLTLVNGVPQWAAGYSGYAYPVTLLTGHEADWSALGTSPAAATATIASSQVTIDTPASTSCDILTGGCSTDAVRAVRTIPYYEPASWSLRARLVSVSAYGLYVTMFGVACGSSWSTSVAKYVVYIVGGSDNVVIARYAAAGSTHGSASVANIRSGEGWIRFDALGRTLTVYAAVGVAGAEPTSWGTPIGTVTLTVTDPQPQRVVILSTGSTAGSARSAVWDSVRLQAVQ